MHTSFFLKPSTSAKKRFLVIGAGPAGLCTLRRLSGLDNVEITCYEQTKEIGGNWVYNPKSPSNIPFQNDDPSSVYEGMRTIYPKEIMSFPDFAYPSDIMESFVESKVILEYLQGFSDKFDLKKFIIFEHTVIRVRPHLRRCEWEVYVWNMIKDEYEIYYYDHIIVCNGQSFQPRLPVIENMEEFKGRQLHSHFYRKPILLKDQKVCIVGSGVSALEIAALNNKTAQHIYLSHKTNTCMMLDNLPNVTSKPPIKRFLENGALFEDDTTETFDIVLFCTGYNYDFPGLSADCQIRLWDNHVYPLYKQCINIHHPSMALIGTPRNISVFQICDLQIRFVLEYFMENLELPPKPKMMKDLEDEIERFKEEGLEETEIHDLSKSQFDYYKDLSETAKIENIKPVMQKIMQEFTEPHSKYLAEWESYKNVCYRIIDDDQYVKLDI